MKNLYLILLILAIACKKDDSLKNPILGKWFLAESEYGTGSGFNIYHTEPTHPISIEFRNDGKFSIDTQYVYSNFQASVMHLDRYRLQSDTLTFYSTSRNEELKVLMELDQKLYLYTLGCRESCIDKFQRRF
jgi:hypothetical protein